MPAATRCRRRLAAPIHPVIESTNSDRQDCENRQNRIRTPPAMLFPDDSWNVSSYKAAR